MRTFLLALYSKTSLDLSFLNFTEGAIDFSYEILKLDENKKTSVKIYQVQVRVGSNKPMMPINMELQVSIDSAIEDEDSRLVQLDLTNFKEDLKSMISLNMIEQDFDFDSKKFSSLLNYRVAILIESKNFNYKTEKFIKSHIVFDEKSNIKVFDLVLCETADLNSHLLNKEVTSSDFFIFKEFDRATQEVQNWISSYVFDLSKKVSPKIILTTKKSSDMDRDFVRLMKVVDLNFINEQSKIWGGKV